MLQLIIPVTSLGIFIGLVIASMFYGGEDQRAQEHAAAANAGKPAVIERAAPASLPSVGSGRTRVVTDSF